MIATNIAKNADQIDPALWNILLRGASISSGKEERPMPEEIKSFIKLQSSWEIACQLEEIQPEKFGQLTKQLVEHCNKWNNYEKNCEIKDMFDKMPCGYSEQLTRFEKLLILKIVRPEKLNQAFNLYVKYEMGEWYATSPLSSMEYLFSSSDCITPIIFVLSQGADPTE